MVPRCSNYSRSPDKARRLVTPPLEVVEIKAFGLRRKAVVGHADACFLGFGFNAILLLQALLQFIGSALLARHFFLSLLE